MLLIGLYLTGDRVGEKLAHFAIACEMDTVCTHPISSSLKRTILFSDSSNPTQIRVAWTAGSLFAQFSNVAFRSSRRTADDAETGLVAQATRDRNECLHCEYCLYSRRLVYDSESSRSDGF